jgi:hypothetical protein
LRKKVSHDGVGRGLLLEAIALRHQIAVLEVRSAMVHA